MNKKKYKLVLLLFLAMVIGTLVFFVLHGRTPLSDKKYGFQYYVPQQMPKGQYIHDSRISVHKYGEKTYGISASMNLRNASHNRIYAIDERRSNASDVDNIKVAANSLEPLSEKPTCSSRQTQKKQLYRLCHWIDSNTIGVHEVNFIKDKTYINTTFPSSKTEAIPVNEIDEYVDSFIRADPPKKVISGI
jgi:hypothetical protein